MSLDTRAIGDAAPLDAELRALYRRVETAAVPGWLSATLEQLEEETERRVEVDA
jgi:hypothetical protein